MIRRLTAASPHRRLTAVMIFAQLAGRTRLGEYLVKINRLSIEQLDQALRTQRYIEESMGERTGIANVLINLPMVGDERYTGIMTAEVTELIEALDRSAAETTQRVAGGALREPEAG